MSGGGSSYARVREAGRAGARRVLEGGCPMGGVQLGRLQWLFGILTQLLLMQAHLQSPEKVKQRWTCSMENSGKGSLILSVGADALWQSTC